MKNNNQFWATLLILWQCSGAAFCYEIASHSRMTEAAHDNSVLFSLSFQSRLGISNDQTFNPRDPSTLVDQGVPAVSAKELMKYGARAEDHGTRPLNHFLDPQNGNRSRLLSYLNSADWALQGSGTVYAQQQKMSYKNASEYYRAGLTATSRADRVKNLGLMFQALGHIVHHLQDMAQPQHVRHDGHCDAKSCETFEAVTGVDTHQSSDYELYARTKESEHLKRACYVNGVLGGI